MDKIYNFTGYITDNTDKKDMDLVAHYCKSDSPYGNGYYLSLKGNINGRPSVDRFFDVRYEVIDDFKEYALDVIKTLWSGEKGSWKFIER